VIGEPLLEGEGVGRRELHGLVGADDLLGDDGHAGRGGVTVFVDAAGERSSLAV
jgi:hypothetical protein